MVVVVYLFVVSLGRQLTVISWCVVELKGAVGQIVQGDRHTVFAVEQNKAVIPPNYSRYLAWGFPDMSVRIGYYDSDKVSLSLPLTSCL